MSEWRGRYFHDEHAPDPYRANAALFKDEDGNVEDCFSGCWCWACDQEHIRVLTAEVARLTAEIEGRGEAPRA